MSPAASRRPLRFATIDEVLADVATLAAADAAGTLRVQGAWTFGQILDHLATWGDYSYDGIPLKIPSPVRWLVRPFKRRFLAGPMRAGVRLPGTKSGTLADAVVPAATALPHLQATFGRLAREAPTRPHPIFGPMTQDEWVALHLRHAELHLSFLAPG